jgi:N-acetylglutamate synthase-like GNAT family acetyltransferase
MMAMIEAEARSRGVAWLFLESGVRNHRAHGFFETAGFATVSHVFGKPLTPG